MMTRTTFALALSLVAVVSGCDSEVEGGGGGAGGEGGAESIATGTGGAPSTATTTSSSTAETTSSGVTSSAVTSTGTGAGGNTLGECTQDGGTSSGSSGGTFQCDAELTCDGGAVEVSCVDDGTTETCDCNLDGALVGTCVDEDRSGCGFPQNCCFTLLGGQAEPNPGPYGACEETGGSGSAASGGGEQSCTSFLECDGGEAEIDCTQIVGEGDATCECSDGQGFVLGTCTQPTLECGYQTSCCYEILN